MKNNINDRFEKWKLYLSEISFNKWILGVLFFIALVVISLFIVLIVQNKRTNGRINKLQETSIKPTSGDIEEHLAELIDIYLNNLDTLPKVQNKSKAPTKVKKTVLDLEKTDIKQISKILNPPDLKKDDIFISFKNVGPFGEPFVITKEEITTLITLIAYWAKEDYHEKRYEVLNLDINNDKKLDVFLFDNSFGNTWKLNKKMDKFDKVLIEDLKMERTQSSDALKLIHILTERFSGIEIAFKDTIVTELR